MTASWMGGNWTTNPRIHAKPETPKQQRATDEAFFADWSAGDDDLGLWLWPEPTWRAIVVRPVGTSMVDALRHLGGRERCNHQGQYGSGDWLIAASRWRELQAALPALANQRRAYFARWFVQIGPIRTQEFLAKVAKRKVK
jgi:hypothetical protein